jgi:hypothetical protein
MITVISIIISITCLTLIGYLFIDSIRRNAFLNYKEQYRQELKDTIREVEFKIYVSKSKILAGYDGGEDDLEFYTNLLYKLKDQLKHIDN